MNVATVFESSEPDSIILRQSGIISVVSKKLITSCSSVFTSAPEKKHTYFVKTYFCSSLKNSLLYKKNWLFGVHIWGRSQNTLTMVFFDHLLPQSWDLLPCDRWQKSDIFETCNCLPLGDVQWLREQEVRWTKKMLIFVYVQGLKCPSRCRKVVVRIGQNCAHVVIEWPPSYIRSLWTLPKAKVLIFLQSTQVGSMSFAIRTDQ